jgi:hypothetical protein
VSGSPIQDRAAIVGIGQSPFGREPILAACEDAGVSSRALDGIVHFVSQGRAG